MVGTAKSEPGVDGTCPATDGTGFGAEYYGE